MNKRDFIKLSAFSMTGLLLFDNLLTSCKGADSIDTEAPHILLRSGWQTENIGDVAHTPGMLVLLEKHFPEAKVTVWPWYSYLPEEKVTMLKNRFPKVSIATGSLSEDGKASTPELQEAIASADFFLHNSGPATIAWQDAANFKKITGKPFGVFGVTYGLYGALETPTLSDASFVYLRDSVSLKKVKDLDIKAPVIKFVPDAVFSIDVADDERGGELLKANGLEDGKFIVCLPKQRHTPMWLHKVKNRPFDPEKHARNEEMKEHDHIPLRNAIIEVVRKTDHKVLIANEDETELPIGKDWVYDHLPEDVKPRVVWLDRAWDLEEAIGVYKRSSGLFGNEMHSPIMCIAHDIPAIVCRWEEQSSKGLMWKDLGLGEWLFDFDNDEEIKRLVPAVLDMVQNNKAARAKAKKARELAQELQKEGIEQMKQFVQA